MTAYNIIQQHPEWVTSERTPRAAIQNEARRYERELEGSKNFSSLITEDLDDLLRHWDATNDFAGIVTENGNKTQVSEESPEYMADKRKAQIYAIFIKAVISELSGKAICTAAQVEEWRERYAVKLEGLQGKTEQITKVVRELKPIADLKAEKIYIKLKNLCYIDCDEDVFLWHFGERKRRKEMRTPDKIRWHGDTISVFSLVGDGICEFAGHKRAEWNLLRQHFSIGWTNDQLAQGKQDALDNQEREEIAPIAKALEEIRKADEEERIKRREEAVKQEAVKEFLEDYMK